jgi:hypothetical protein
LFSVLTAQDKHENSVFVSTSRISNLIFGNKKVLVSIRKRNFGLFKMVASTVLPANPEVYIASDNDFLQLYHCEGCQNGKSHKLKFGAREHTTGPGQLIHADVCGQSARGHRYFVLFEDDHSKNRHVYFMKK